MTKFSSNLTALLKAKNMKAPDLSEAMGKPRDHPSAYKWLNGSTAPMPASLSEIAKALNVKLTVLTGERLTKGKTKPVDGTIKAIAGPIRISGVITTPTTDEEIAVLTKRLDALAGSMARLEREVRHRPKAKK